MAEKIIPGIYQTDTSNVNKLEEEYEQEIEKSQLEAKKWAKHKTEYTHLKEKLSTITDKTTHNVMVPFGGKKAFFEGQLIHTNEIMVLLGDNWFAERSAKEASEICDRRITRCNEMLEKLDKEIQLYQSWHSQAHQLKKDSDSGEGNIEIRESFDENEEKEWRIKHRQRVKEAKISEKETVPDNQEADDDDLWRRLDELELEEEMETYESTKKNNLEIITEIDEEDDDEISDDLSESPDLSDDENAQEDIKQELLKEMARLKERLPDIHEASKTNETVKTVQEIVKHDTKKEPSTPPLTPIKKSRFTVKHRRSVSFGDVSERLFSQEQSQPAINFSEALNEDTTIETKVIEFDTSSAQHHVLPSSSSIYPTHPGDLIRIYGPVKSPIYEGGGKKVPKKSILRTKSKYGPLAPKDKRPRASFAAAVKSSTSLNAVSETVVERSVENFEIPELTKVSKAAVSDTVVERQTQPAFNKNPGDQQVDQDSGPKTQKFSRFRATRVYK